MPGVDVLLIGTIAELATAIRSADYLAQDAGWPDPR
jgi:hypothetical protein